MSGAAWIGNAAVAVALIVAYVIVTGLGHDGDHLLLVLGGQALGTGATHVAEKVQPSG